MAVLGKSHLILNCAHNHPQTLIARYVLIFCVIACLPPFPQKMHHMPFSKIVQSYYHNITILLHNKKSETSWENLMKKIRVPPPPFSLSELKLNSFLSHIVKESICHHRKVLTQYYSYRAHKKRQVLFYILNLLHYLPEHHLHCKNHGIKQSVSKVGKDL